MWVRRGVWPVVRAATYRRATFLLLGGLLLAAYAALGSVLARLWGDGAVARPVAGLLTAVAVTVAVVPLFVGGTRRLEIAAGRALLDADLPEPLPDRRTDAGARVRTALFVATHLAAGGVVLLGLLTVVPATLVLVAWRLGVPADALPSRPFGSLAAHRGTAAALVGLAALIAFAYLVAGLGAGTRALAPRLLGPSPRERLAALQARTGQLAQRDRLARELHDSIGHALTITTLQAAAARELLDSDTEFAREALRTIEESGRRAMDELDHVLGLLREQDPKPVPRHTLADLDRLVAETRAAGVPVEVEVCGPVDRLPAVVSREGYRIVQEGLTNAARHAAGTAVTLRVAAPRTGLDIDVANAVGTAAVRGGGRGLAGMRERVRALGGSMSAGQEGSTWRVRVSLPAPPGDA